MWRIKTYKDPEKAELRKKQRECMQRLRAKRLQERLEKQKIEHKVILNTNTAYVNRLRTEFRNIT